MLFSTATYPDDKQACQDMLNRMAGISEHLSGRLGIFKCVTWIRVFRCSRKAAGGVRRSFFRGYQSSDRFYSSLSEQYTYIKRVRDEHLRAWRALNTSKKPGGIKKTLGRFLEKALAEWDELAEECLIGGDREIQTLVKQIAENG